MTQLHVKKGDAVMVIAGKDKGKSGEILHVNPQEGKVVVDGVNIVSKCVKPKSAQEKGGIVKQSAPINSSNVMPICPSCGKVTRINYAADEETGKKVRICKHCGKSLEIKVKAKKVAKKAVKTAKKSTAKKDKE